MYECTYRLCCLRPVVLAVLLKVTAVILTQLLIHLQTISLVNQLIWSKNYTKMESQLFSLHQLK